MATDCLWPIGQITARLGAIAMPKGVLAALVATADQDRRHCHLVHAAEDCLCDWKPTATDLDMLQQSLHITHVEASARWMGSGKHNCWHWLQCQLQDPMLCSRLGDTWQIGTTSTPEDQLIASVQWHHASRNMDAGGEEGSTRGNFSTSADAVWAWCPGRKTPGSNLTR